MPKQSDMCASFAKGDFSSLANSFGQAGFVVQQPLPGVIQICAPGGLKSTETERMRLLISVGVHGDETAPIEMMALLLNALTKSAPSSCSLAVDLLIVLGNIQAIAQARRFIDEDLNRLFAPERISRNETYEARRADQLMQVTASFFDGYKNKLHLDLHTAIRDSVYSTFAIVPGENNPGENNPGENNLGLIRWLGAAGIAAVVLSPKPSATFSSYTCAHFGAVSCTAELGRIGKLGKNDLSQFITIERAIDALMRTGSIHVEQSASSYPQIFCVAHEVIKRSDAFQLAFDSHTKNFTAFAPNTVLATDNEITYSVGAAPEFVLFPNAGVRIGTRAALMVVPVSTNEFPRHGKS